MGLGCARTTPQRGAVRASLGMVGGKYVRYGVPSQLHPVLDRGSARRVHGSCALNAASVPNARVADYCRVWFAK